jgi:hypothetical protein
MLQYGWHGSPAHHERPRGALEERLDAPRFGEARDGTAGCGRALIRIRGRWGLENLLVVVVSGLGF